MPSEDRKRTKLSNQPDLKNTKDASKIVIQKVSCHFPDMFQFKLNPPPRLQIITPPPKKHHCWHFRACACTLSSEGFGCGALRRGTGAGGLSRPGSSGSPVKYLGGIMWTCMYTCRRGLGLNADQGLTVHHNNT